MGALWNRLRQRKLFQWALAYLAGAWLLLQVLDLLAGRFGWPDALFRVAAVLLGVGFLAALVLAWYHGERGEQKVTAMEIGMLAGILVMAGAAVAFVGGGTGERAPAPDPAAARSPESAAVAEQGSVAVLRFADMSPAQDQEYLSDGIAEEILNALAKLEGLRVAARTSSFSFEGKDVPIPEIARQLEVAHVLEGSVQRAGDRVRITAQRIDAKTGYHLWSEKYDREIDDVFAVQDEIARAIVEALRVTLTGDRGGRLAEAGTDDIEAYSLYLQGRFYFNKYTEADLRRSIELYQQALAKDPGYARASAAIAFVWTGLADDWVAPKEAYPQARAAALQALALDSTLSAGHVALGAVLMLHDWDLAGA
jgi:TolB-like protein